MTLKGAEGLKIIVTLKRTLASPRNIRCFAVSSGTLRVSALKQQRVCRPKLRHWQDDLTAAMVSDRY